MMKSKYPNIRKDSEVAWITNGRGDSHSLVGQVLAVVPKGTAISDLRVAKKYKNLVPRNTLDCTENQDRALVLVKNIDGDVVSDVVKVPKAGWLITADD